jgi:hypothetical protein
VPDRYITASTTGYLKTTSKTETSEWMVLDRDYCYRVVYSSYIPQIGHTPQGRAQALAKHLNNGGAYPRPWELTPLISRLLGEHK